MKVGVEAEVRAEAEAMEKTEKVTERQLESFLVTKKPEVVAEVG